MSEKKFTITDTGDGNTAHRNDCGCGRCNQPLVGRVEPVGRVYHLTAEDFNECIFRTKAAQFEKIARLEAENKRLRELLDFAEQWLSLPPTTQSDRDNVARLCKRIRADLRRAANAMKEGE